MADDTDNLLWREYPHLPGFECLYLEDSFVLDVCLSDQQLKFVMEFVLTKDHPLFLKPEVGEKYCYKRGALLFSPITHIEECELTGTKYSDAHGDVDLGNIDSFIWADGRYILSGDWGKVDVCSGDPKVVYN